MNLPITPPVVVQWHEGEGTDPLGDECLTESGEIANLLGRRAPSTAWPRSDPTARACALRPHAGSCSERPRHASKRSTPSASKRSTEARSTARAPTSVSRAAAKIASTSDAPLIACVSRCSRAQSAAGPAVGATGSSCVRCATFPWIVPERRRVGAAPLTPPRVPAGGTGRGRPGSRTACRSSRRRWRR